MLHTNTSNANNMLLTLLDHNQPKLGIDKQSE